MSKPAVTPNVINYNLTNRMSEQPPLNSSTTTTTLCQHDGSAWDGYTAPFDQHTTRTYGNSQSPPSTAVPDALDLPNNLLHLRYVFDTGATHVLSSPSVHEALKTAHPSRLEITGSHGSQTQFGKLAGTLSGCPVGSAMTTPFTFGTDTHLLRCTSNEDSAYALHSRATGLACIALTQPVASGLTRYHSHTPGTHTNGSWKSSLVNTHKPAVLQNWSMKDASAIPNWPENSTGLTPFRRTILHSCLLSHLLWPCQQRTTVMTVNHTHLIQMNATHTH